MFGAKARAKLENKSCITRRDAHCSQSVLDSRFIYQKSSLSIYLSRAERPLRQTARQSPLVRPLQAASCSSSLYFAQTFLSAFVSQIGSFLCRRVAAHKAALQLNSFALYSANKWSVKYSALSPFWPRYRLIDRIEFER